MSRTAALMRGRRESAGLALLAVLWVVAALSIISVGLAYSVRGELRDVVRQKELSAAGAIADAGVMLAARDLAVRSERELGYRTYEVNIDGSAVRVQIVPLSGLIDLNAAGESLLTDLFEFGGGVAADVANTLAQRTLDWRSAGDVPRARGAKNDSYIAAGSPFRIRGGPFATTEDLLQVLGVDYDLYVKLASLVTVYQVGSGRVDPTAAPWAVLRVLARGNEQIAAQYVEARERLGPMADSTRFPGESVGHAPTTRYRVEASVQLENRASIVSTSVIDVSLPDVPMPWTTYRTERHVVAAQ